MPKPTIKIAIPPRGYASLESLAQTVILYMTTAAANFPAPSPPLSSLQSAANTLSWAIADWGPQGMRGSKKDLLRLRSAATTMRNLLIKEKAYVLNRVDPAASPEEQAEFIASSGFAIKNVRNPQGRLQHVEQFRHVISPRFNNGQVLLRWNKPLNVTVNSNVKVYFVFRSPTVFFEDAEFVDGATRTTFVDRNPVRNAANTYFIVPFNNAGRGVISNAITVHVN